MQGSLVGIAVAEGAGNGQACRPEAFEACAFGNRAGKRIVSLHEEGELLLEQISARSICEVGSPRVAQGHSWPPGVLMLSAVSLHKRSTCRALNNAAPAARDQSARATPRPNQPVTCNCHPDQLAALVVATWPKHAAVAASLQQLQDVDHRLAERRCAYAIDAPRRSLALSSVVQVNGVEVSLVGHSVHVPCSRKDASNKCVPGQARSVLARVPATSNRRCLIADIGRNRSDRATRCS